MAVVKYKKLAAYYGDVNMTVCAVPKYKQLPCVVMLTLSFAPSPQNK